MSDTTLRPGKGTTVTATTASTSTATSDTAAGRSLGQVAAFAGGVAAAATTVIGAVAKAADVPLTVGDLEIQVPMFAVLTILATAIGVGIASLVVKRGSQPRRTFLLTTIGLTALSLVPDVTADATTATKATLIAAHLVAAIIVIPALAAAVGARRDA
jgi:hypothetical protein